MVPPRRQLKRESTIVVDGLITPNESMSTTGTITPKQEDSSISFSDNFEDKFAGASFRSHDGLPLEDDDHVIAERQRRSASVSARTSRPTSRHTIDRNAADMPSTIPGGSLRIVGEKVKMLVDAIEELRQLGLKQIDTKLPELVLVGDQSAGKSTLMGAIAEINLPKNKGMCTRCPANIKTSPAPNWSCKVSLHEYYSYTSDTRRVPTKSQPFPPWKENEDHALVINHFKTTSDKAELEDILRWAQVALLNPSQDFKSFIPGSGHQTQVPLRHDQKHEADFSPNLVAIEISGPGLPALSFYDLPGIFVSAATKEEQYLVKVFENLATKYIKHERALIICAITMQNDPGLSRTSAIIDLQKAGDRCIGVLTMPDRLQEGAMHMDYDAILRGKAHVFPKGYFITKQPGPDFRQHQEDYHAQARHEEEHFFDTDSRWTGSWREFRHKCGTTAIQQYLSQEFAQQITSSMPDIDKKIKEQLQKVDERLADLPELPNENVQHVVRERLADFSNGVQRLIEGGPQSNEFLSSWSELSNDFRDAIQSMKPMFNYNDKSDMALPEVINLDDDSDDETASKMSAPSFTPSKRSNESATMPNSKRPKIYNDSAIPFNRDSVTARSNGVVGLSPVTKPKQETGLNPPTPRRIIPPPKSQTQTSDKRTTFFDAFLGSGRNFMKICEVRQNILKHARPGLPDHVDDFVKEDICLQSIQPWDDPLNVLADRTFTMLGTAIEQMLLKTLGMYQQTDLYRTSHRHIRQFLDDHFAKQRKVLDDFFELETYKRFTINDAAFATYRAEELKILEAARRGRRARCYIITEATMAKKALTDEQKTDRAKKITDEQLGPDPFQKEIDLAAYVRGYYKTAAYRFTDNVCQNIQGTIFRKIHKEIKYLLERCLKLDIGDGEATCRTLMVEDRGEAKARAALQTEKASLTKAADRLAKLVREFAEGVNYEPGFQYGSIEEHERDVSVEPARRPLPNGSINDYHSATISENHDRMVVEAENHVPVKLREISISDAGDI